MSSSFKYAAAASLLLAACAQAPQKVAPAPTAAAPAPQRETVEAAPALPNVELTEDLLYEYLLTEIAGQRGQRGLAMEGISDLARKTRDPRLARRAAQIALESGQMQRAVDALRKWREIEPGSVMAGRMLASLLLRGGKLDEAGAVYAELLKAAAPNTAPDMLQALQQIGTLADRAAALKLMQKLAEPYPKLAEARWAVAYLAYRAGDTALAQSEVRQARSLRPEWEQPVLLEAQLLLKSDPQQGLETLRRFLAERPNAHEVRLQYARALLDRKEYKAARTEFQRLSEESPEDADLAFAVALISLQLKDYRGAEEQLTRALGAGKQDQGKVQYYLGQLGEAKEDIDDALAHYRLVTEGEQRYPAQLRVVYLLNKRDGVDVAREYLRQIQIDDNRQRVQLLLVEAQLLRESNRFEEGFHVLEKGLEALPNHPDLLYEAAMLADRTGRHEQSEKWLRKLIQLQPGHAHAYNALGYSLLERNERVAEGLQLVEKAHELAPDDAAIMDSVGWGYFRNGRMDESVGMLRRAYAANPDPEIASHLGEALWARGDKDEARALLNDSLKAHPESVLLQAVVKRLFSE